MIVAVIPAKGKSNRLPKKNMSVINGKPMIDYTIQYARSFDLIDDIYVSTEDKSIREHCLRLNLKVIKRPIHLCGEASIIEVYRHAFNYIGSNKINILIGLQPDHPDRKKKLKDVFEIYIENKADQLISRESNGSKNGAHYILSKKVLEGN